MKITTRTQGGNILRGNQGAVSVKGYIKGGPEFARKLQQLEKGVRDELLAEVTQAGAEVVAEEWRQQVRSVIGLGPGAAHYAEAIAARSRPGKRGATGIVGLKKVPVSDGEAQPQEYASRFEFGSTTRSLQQYKAGVTHAGRARAAKPTLRPAFDASKGRALDAMGDKAWELIERAV